MLASWENVLGSISNEKEKNILIKYEMLPIWDKLSFHERHFVVKMTSRKKKFLLINEKFIHKIKTLITVM